MKNIQANQAGHGGRRKGAGRKPGELNKRTAALLAKVDAGGETPLDFLLRMMRDTGAEEAKRIDCAKAAAPYVHARLNSIDAKVDHDGKITLTWEG